LPTVTVPLKGESAEAFQKLIESLEDHEDVQAVYHNGELENNVD